jgi:hypothetical protein
MIEKTREFPVLDVPFAYGPSVPVINVSLRGANLILIGMRKVRNCDARALSLCGCFHNQISAFYLTGAMYGLQLRTCQILWLVIIAISSRRQEVHPRASGVWLSEQHQILAPYT